MDNKKSSFFSPFVGEKYKDGVNGKKILVIGASFYCNKTSCKYFKQCTNVDTKDSSPYDDRCPDYQQEGGQLHDEPTNSVGNQYAAYKTFARYMAKWCGSDDYDEIWSHFAFTNYVQFFLPATSDSFRETRQSDLSERDFKSFNETVVELQPDIVVIWGCVISSRLREGNEFLVSRKELDDTEWYVCHIKLEGMNKQVALINPYHPSSSAWHSKLPVFDKYLSSELNK